MSKTIDLQVEKSTRLINALKAQIDDVHDKGISLEELDAMSNQLNELYKNSEDTEVLRKHLSEQVKRTNRILAQCKEMYIRTKNVVRNNYPQEEWIKYGVIDKR